MSEEESKSDLTVIRIAPAEYLIITEARQTVRDFDWITRMSRPRKE
jgi:glycine cleavage system aminomethyltransferase T